MHQPIFILKPFWDQLFKSPWKFGLALIFVWGIPRFILVLLANQSGNYQWLSLIFVSMWLTPWIFLSKLGRYKIGLKKPDSWIWLLYAFIVGILLCALMFLLADILYADTINNWFVYISNSYSNIPENISASDKMIYFSIYAFVSMLFSPIGEEFFYRGIVHECFATHWNDKIASLIDSAAFSITHLAHFGIIYHLGAWDLLLLPALIWMSLLFLTSLFFSIARRKSGSILGSIFAHAAFNLAMIYFIFFYVL